jgi:tetrahydromethanopterin S-methyltransferase subunit F
VKSLDPRGWFCLLAFILFLCLPSTSIGHDVADHLDPELLTGWRTWLHLTIQWIHLVAFALWLGLTAGTLLLEVKPSLDRLLYPAWILLLIILATGNYNMEYSAGISEIPSVLLLPVLGKIPYGVTYTTILAIKLGLYVLAVLVALVTTLLHLCTKLDKSFLRKAFLVSQSVLVVLIALATATILFYHEVADLWPTPVHSLGGVVGPEGPRADVVLNENTSPPNDFRLLTTSAGWIDISIRWIHLLGFGLLVGSSAATLLFSPADAARFLSISWAALLLQMLSGIASMNRWTPFDVPAYFWNLEHLSHIRFGHSYALFMAAKHVFVLADIILLVIWTIRYRSGLRRQNGTMAVGLRSLAGATLCLGLVIGCIMMIILLLHEGVDHAL